MVLVLCINIESLSMKILNMESDGSIKIVISQYVLIVNWNNIFRIIHLSTTSMFLELSIVVKSLTETFFIVSISIFGHDSASSSWLFNFQVLPI